MGKFHNVDARSEARIAEYARIRDIELKNANESFQRQKKRLEEDFRKAMERNEAILAHQKEEAFSKFERCQEGVMNFISNRADAAKIKSFGLSLPFIHDVNTFGRPYAQSMADQIADKRVKAGA